MPEMEEGIKNLIEAIASTRDLERADLEWAYKMGYHSGKIDGIMSCIKEKKQK